VRLLTAALILFVIDSAALAQGESWRIGDDQPFPTQISSLPSGERQSILNALRPSLEQRAKDRDLDSDELQSIRGSLRLRRIKDPAGTLLLVQATDIEACGAVGNCAVWALDAHLRLILDGVAYKLSVQRSVHRGQPSILTYEHISASQFELTRYSFDGRKYRESVCGVQSSEIAGKIFDPPRVDLFPCAK
jgi:hypothetical protein